MKYLIISTISILLIYFGYYFWITEHYIVEIENGYKIDFSISPDETFLDGQDDYKFKFYKKEKSPITLSIPNCPSRCWVLNKQDINPDILFLSGCQKNSSFIYKIDFSEQEIKRISKIPENSTIIDTLTNLYIDNQLPPNYKFPN